MSVLLRFGIGIILLAATASTPGADETTMKPQSIDRGRYLARIAGCNDCHTPGYATGGGNLPEEQWLTGDRLGWRGPWGTTYPGNLRTFMPNISEDEWVRLAGNVRYRPPMPWFALRDMHEEDLRALHRFVRHLGPAGEPAPSFVPPGEEPDGAYILFPLMPQ